GGSGLYAFNAANGAQIFHSAAFGVNHFVTPAEAGGQIFVPSHSIIRSFNMDFACAATPLFRSYFSWFDSATAGMVGDNIHLVNPGTSTATGSVSLPGASAIPFTVAGGGQAHVTFPTGKIGGPVTITANQPVLSSQRVQYYQSFNEAIAHGATEALTTSYFNWFDRATAGMVGDNIHVLNPGGAAAHVTVTLPGASPIAITVAPG